jgi:hypothetical protein
MIVAIETAEDTLSSFTVLYCRESDSVVHLTHELIISQVQRIQWACQWCMVKLREAEL